MGWAGFPTLKKSRICFAERRMGWARLAIRKKGYARLAGRTMGFASLPALKKSWICFADGMGKARET